VNWQINQPEIVKEVRAAFDRYEKALVENDVATLDALFWDSAHTVRYGVAEELYGYDAIRNFRASRPAADLRRNLTNVAIATFGSDFAAVSCEFRRSESGLRGRQMQTWARTADGWKVVAAHVSLSR
jgi:ketosteroid isomerase-like protein